jgi:hypothetical protein
VLASVARRGIVDLARRRVVQCDEVEPWLGGKSAAGRRDLPAASF